MLADDNSTPILMDFGSALPARIPIPDRRVALLQQDLAAEHCSMPFRAPELFDVSFGRRDEMAGAGEGSGASAR